MTREIFLLLFVTTVTGYGNAPGTYPREELSDYVPTVPQSPYGNGGGYQFYYEKDPPKSLGKGKLPPFKPVVVEKESFPKRSEDLDPTAVDGSDGAFAVYNSAEDNDSTTPSPKSKVTIIDTKDTNTQPGEYSPYSIGTEETEVSADASSFKDAYNDWKNKKPKYVNSGEPQEERLSVIEDVVESAESIDTNDYFEVEQFKKKSREPLVREQFLGNTKDVVMERSGLDMKNVDLKNAKQCCSCCDKTEPVLRNVETKVEPSVLVDEAQDTGDNYLSSPGSSQYGRVASPREPQADQLLSPYARPQLPVTVKQNSQPISNLPEFQNVGYVDVPKYGVPQPPQYPPQYSPPYQPQTPACGCQQPVSQPCCQPIRPCCLPQIPCCPQPQCCPQPRICCQPIQPICLPQPEISCCTISFNLPTINFPICGRACPSCPCRRRVHRAKRVKRFVSSGPCTKCSVMGEPWRPFHHRSKRHSSCSAAPNPLLQPSGCSTCGPTHRRVKRMGCLPCLGRKKREVEEHTRVKRMGCLPCLNGRKKRSLGACQSCSNLGGLLGRYKRSFSNCTQCGGRKKRQVTPTCSCAPNFQTEVTRGKRDVKRVFKKETCDKSCCDYTQCPERRTKKSFLNQN